MEPNGIDKKDKVEDKESKEGQDEKRFPAIAVRQRSSKHDEDDGGKPLWDLIVNLYTSHILLCFCLQLLVLGEVGTELWTVLQVDLHSTLYLGWSCLQPCLT